MHELLERLRAFRDARDWKQFHRPKDLAISLTLEAAELLQIFQWLDQTAPLSEEQRQAVSGEAADILIYLLYLCDRLDIDLAASTSEKISQNDVRYPVTLSRGVAGRRRPKRSRK